ncbi:MAG: pseudouridine synthase [Ardenticatenaceae bacterium]|nr:pseudouridine synthase [Ardenticatenaceae bacterium]
MPRLILLNKPFNTMCQFTDRDGRATLADFISIPNIYAAGRLDFDSEGLVILTDAGWLQHHIAEPQHKLPKTYLVQVERIPDEKALAQLRRGVKLKEGVTLPAKVRLIDPPPIWERTPPVRFRKSVPTAWLELQIIEGKKRQIRRMTATVGFPTLRLIRSAIGPWTLGNLQPGQWLELPCPQNVEELKKLLRR